ncbi:MAG: hypothetical protein H6618_02420 [Deltaproteobacteria bacterium]|nr:hypothetical protein [Deltaproteobacteria bacterium]
MFIPATLKQKPLCFRLIPYLFAFISVNCGDNGHEDKKEDPRSVSERVFDEAAGHSGIPVRLLIASAYIESGIKPLASGSEGQWEPASLQSAFGLSRQTLGLDNGARGDRLDSQITAYADWLSRKMPQGLKASPQTDEEKYNWIWAMAEAHRNDDSTRTLYAIEMIEALNKGFLWTDPENNNIIAFREESPPINLDNLRTVSSNHLQLSNLTTSSPNQVYAARFLRLHNQGTHHRSQTPTKIRIVHCPLSFSGCIEEQLWDGQSEKKMWMGAHYLVPSSANISEMPLQIYPHDEAVPVTDSQGRMNFSQDEVVIALTGLSGKIRDGVRKSANPLWLSEFQLRNLNALTDYICDRLAYDNPQITRIGCLETGNGIHFQTNPANTPLTWGDIPDFDPIIFHSYIGNRHSLSGKTVIEHPDNKRIYKSGDAVRLNLTFGLRAKSLELERLIRCPDNERAYWSVIDREMIRSQNSFMFEKTILGSGPNQDGNHYFRAKVFDEDNQLLGWDQAHIYITDYEPGPDPVFPGDCLSRP